MTKALPAALPAALPVGGLLPFAAFGDLRGQPCGNGAALDKGRHSRAHMPAAGRYGLGSRQPFAGVPFRKNRMASRRSAVTSSAAVNRAWV